MASYKMLFIYDRPTATQVHLVMRYWKEGHKTCWAFDRQAVKMRLAVPEFDLIVLWVFKPVKSSLILKMVRKKAPEVKLVACVGDKYAAKYRKESALVLSNKISAAEIYQAIKAFLKKKQVTTKKIISEH